MRDKFNKEGLFDGEEVTVTITLEDDTDIECVVLNIFEADGREYMSVLPIDEEYEEVYIYRYSENENGEPELSNIESDEEYEIVADAFDEILDQQDFEELLEDENGEF